MTAKAVTNISFNMNGMFELTGEIHELQLSIIEFIPYFKSSTSLRSINTKLSLMVPLMESYANSMLDDGWKIPLPQNITKYIKNEKV